MQALTPSLTWPTLARTSTDPRADRCLHPLAEPPADPHAETCTGRHAGPAAHPGTVVPTLAPTL
eukprot:8119929-Alexandrium_andersonii.AAC.1